MTGLRSLGRDQGGHLQTFRGSGEADLLTRLAHAECLLGLARLSAPRLDLAAYPGLAVGVITQFVPSRLCSITVEIPDLPVVRAVYGQPDLPAVRTVHGQRGGPQASVPPMLRLQSDVDEASRRTLHVDGEPAGELVVLAEVAELAPAGLLDALAEQVSSSLSALAEAERGRRRAALSRALRLAEGIGDTVAGDDLVALADALASLPNALGARLEVGHPSVGDRTVATTSGSAPPPSEDVEAVTGGWLSVAVRWSVTAADTDRAALGQVRAALAGALGRADERRLLRDQAETDPLTGVANRRRGMQALAEATAQSGRSGEPVAALYLDLDDFKRVNDTLGHGAGDELLVRFAEHLSTRTRAGDTVARVGGEEFLVVCPGLEEGDGAVLLQRIVDSTPASCAVALPAGWHQTVSCGLACFPADGATPEALLAAADRALYGAKRAGRDRLQVASGRHDWRRRSAS